MALSKLSTASLYYQIWFGIIIEKLLGLGFTSFIIVMSALLKDRVWVMLSGVAKRGIYPLHASRLGVFRIPTEITEHSDISSITMI